MTNLSGLPAELRKAAFCLRCYGYGRPEVTEVNCPFNHDKYVLPAVLVAKEMLSREAVKKALDWLFNEIGRLRDSDDNISIHEHADALLEVREKLGFDPYEAEKEEEGVFRDKR